MTRHARPRPDPLPITVDTREQRPLLFPRYLQGPSRTWEIALTSKALPFADYAPTGSHELAAVERKYRLREIERNMEDWRDKHRSRRAFRKFAHGCTNKYLLLDMSVGSLFPRGEIVSPVVFKLMQVVRGYGFHLIGPVSARSVDTRRRLGELVAILFASHLWPDDEWNMEAVGGNGWSDVTELRSTPAAVIVPARRRPRFAPAVVRKKNCRIITCTTPPHVI